MGPAQIIREEFPKFFAQLKGDEFTAPEILQYVQPKLPRVDERMLRTLIKEELNRQEGVTCLTVYKGGGVANTWKYYGKMGVKMSEPYVEKSPIVNELEKMFSPPRPEEIPKEMPKTTPKNSYDKMMEAREGLIVAKRRMKEAVTLWEEEGFPVP